MVPSLYACVLQKATAFTALNSVKRDCMIFHKKGQGATEYLVLLAVVLIIALVSIALLGFFPGLATDAKLTQSTSYWRSEARPFAILETSITHGGNVTIIMQNVEATGTYTLQNLSLATAIWADNFSSATPFASGEIKAISFIISNPGVDAGSLYEVQVNMTYLSPNAISNTQFGTKPVIGKYT